MEKQPQSAEKPNKLLGFLKKPAETLLYISPNGAHGTEIVKSPLKNALVDKTPAPRHIESKTETRQRKPLATEMY